MRPPSLRSTASFRFENWGNSPRYFLQVTALEANYPGGIRAYVKNARELLRSSAAGENPFAGMKPEVSFRN